MSDVRVVLNSDTCPISFQTARISENQIVIRPDIKRSDVFCSVVKKIRPGSQKSGPGHLGSKYQRSLSPNTLEPAKNIPL